jgi:hypothetical protein
MSVPGTPETRHLNPVTVTVTSNGAGADADALTMLLGEALGLLGSPGPMVRG